MLCARSIFPIDENQLRLARRRLVFDEFFFFILQVRQLREHREKKANPFSLTGSRYVEQVLSRLPYALTGAQKRTLEEVFHDMEGEGLMNRLIQGGRGIGKDHHCLSGSAESGGAWLSGRCDGAYRGAGPAAL